MLLQVNCFKSSFRLVKLTIYYLLADFHIITYEAVAALLSLVRISIKNENLPNSQTATRLFTDCEHPIYLHQTFIYNFQTQMKMVHRLLR